MYCINTFICVLFDNVTHTHIDCRKRDKEKENATGQDPDHDGVIKKKQTLAKVYRLRYALTIVFYMAICTFVYELINAWQYLSLVSEHSFETWNHYPHRLHYICVLKGVFQQFFELASITWNFILAVCLFGIAFYDSTFDHQYINKRMPYIHTITWYVKLKRKICLFFLD